MMSCGCFSASTGICTRLIFWNLSKEIMVVDLPVTHNCSPHFNRCSVHWPNCPTIISTSALASQLHTNIWCSATANSCHMHALSIQWLCSIPCSCYQWIQVLLYSPDGYSFPISVSLVSTPETPLAESLESWRCTWLLNNSNCDLPGLCLVPLALWISVFCWTWSPASLPQCSVSQKVVEYSPTLSDSV